MSMAEILFMHSILACSSSLAQTLAESALAEWSMLLNAAELITKPESALQ
jgi:hypothetical protein